MQNVINYYLANIKSQNVIYVTLNLHDVLKT